MKWLTTGLFLVAVPAAAQNEGAALPGEAACNAVRERVQVALGQADRALQDENPADVERWTAIAASYSTVYAAFCGDE